MMNKMCKNNTLLLLIFFFSAKNPKANEQILFEGTASVRKMKQNAVRSLTFKEN